MDIDYFHTEGLNGTSTKTWTNEYEYVTLSGEKDFAHLLDVRGLLFGASDAAAGQATARSMWTAAQARMPSSYSDALRTGPMEIAIPEGTKLWLRLPPLPFGYAWGKAALAGTSIDDAWDEISKYLLAGATELAHANSRDLLDHVVNTQLRAAAGITKVTDATRKKALTGDLYFRTHFRGADTALPIAPDAPGVTKLPQWVTKYNATIFQLRGALNAFQQQTFLMGDDLGWFAKFSRALGALYHVGNLVVIRKGDWFGNYNALVHVTKYCQRNVVLRSLPGGDFGFAWSMSGAPVTQSVLDQRKAAIDQYKLLRDAYKKYPAVYVKQLDDLAQLESDIVAAFAVDPQVGALVQDEIKNAVTWIGSGSGDPPDAAGGLGVLLSTINVPLPTELDPPRNVLRLAATLFMVDAMLSAPTDDAGRSALESRIKSGVASVLALPADQKSKLMGKSGWNDLVSAYTTAVDTAKRATYVGKSAIRLTEMPGVITSKDYALGQFLRRVSKWNLDRFALKQGIAVLRAVAFVTTGVGLVDDLVKAGTHRDWDSLEKLTKDSLSAYGSFARDYFGTRATLKQMFTGSLAKEEADSLKALETRFKPTGDLLGVVSGVWSLSQGVSQRNTVLTAASVANVVGYGIRRLSMREAVAGVVGFDVTVPLLLIGAALDLLNALGPAKADALMHKESVNLLKGTVGMIRNFYERHPPWRPEKSAEFEEMLKNVEDMIPDVDKDDAWTPMLPYSDEDVGRTRARLQEIGFPAEAATKLIPTESTYLMRGTPPPALDPKNWPPNWPDFES